MLKFTTVEQVVTEEKNAVLPLPPLLPPVTSPFPIELKSNSVNPFFAATGPVKLAEVTVNLTHDRDGVLLLAAVNWSATFTGGAIARPGAAVVTFEIARNGTVIYQITDTAIGTAVGTLPADTRFPTDTDFRIASFRHFDTDIAECPGGILTYVLQATTVQLIDAVPTVNIIELPTTAAVGAVTLTAEEIEGRRAR